MTAAAGAKLVIGPYSLFEPIASGGMGTVHFARMDEGAMSLIVAVKRLHPHLRSDQTFSTMLLDEARLSQSVRHPNVVQVLDVVSTATDLLLVMEYVPGLSVHELMTHGLAKDARMPVPLPVALTIAVDGLRGLHAAHEALGEDGQPLNLVHRDISPQNLLVDQSGLTKLTDFGVAKAVGRLRSTRDGSIRGKIAYMSPEQVAGSPLDARADTYSFAIVLWELISGRPMFEADSDVGLFAKAMRGATERLAEVVPDIPAAIDSAIWRALARDPRRRYPSALAFADALVAAFGAVDRRWVATWMQGRAADLLEERTRGVRAMLTTSDAMRELEEAPTVALSGPIFGEEVVSPSAPMMLEAPSASQVHAPNLRKSRNIQLAMVGVAAAAVVGAVVMLATSQPVAPPSSEMTIQPIESPALTPASPPMPPPLPTASAAPTEPHPIITNVRPKPRPVGVAKNPQKDSKSDCNPPYTEDEQGRHFKSWCLR